jgi:uncharacterized protein YkwD
VLALAAPSTAVARTRTSPHPPTARTASVTPATTCAGADLQPTAANLAAVRAAVLCLHNQERAARGLPLLRNNAKLAAAAQAHSTEMVTQGYFAHDTSGSTMMSRIRATGYIRPTDTWTVGENIAWGTQQLATAGEIERAWMASPGHRANILRRSFREIGIGIVAASPLAAGQGQPAATFTADFGVRR